MQNVASSLARKATAAATSDGRPRRPVGDGHDIGSPSSVKRALARRDLLRPVRYHAERRQLAKARREAFEGRQALSVVATEFSVDAEC